MTINLPDQDVLRAAALLRVMFDTGLRLGGVMQIADLAGPLFATTPHRSGQGGKASVQRGRVDAAALDSPPSGDRSRGQVVSALDAAWR